MGSEIVKTLIFVHKFGQEFKSDKSWKAFQPWFYMAHPKV